MLAQRMPHGARLGPRIEPSRPRSTTSKSRASLAVRAVADTQQKTDGKVELGRSGVVVDDVCVGAWSWRVSMSGTLLGEIKTKGPDTLQFSGPSCYIVYRSPVRNCLCVVGGPKLLGL